MATYTPPASGSETDPVATVALASAVATLTAAITAKQDLSTAATDAEVAAVQAALVASVAAVQAEVDALEAAGATDIEVAAAVATLAATVATDTELAAHTGDTALDGEPHGLPALSDGHTWVRSGGALVSQDVDAVDTVAGRTGVVVLTKTDVGLASVDNTSDVNKPVSTAQQTADALRIPLTQKAAANGVATLGADSKIPSAQLSPLAITSVQVVASQVAQLALTAQEGDVAVRSDQAKSYVHNGGVAGTMADWTELQTPGNLVLSVNGETGAVTLVAAEVPFIPSGTIAATNVQAAVEEVRDEEAAARSTVSTNLTTHTSATANPHAVTKAQVGLGDVDNTADTAKPVSTVQQTALDLKASLALVDAKGDLLVATAADVLARKAVGTNEQALIVDSARADGLRWAVPRLSLQQRAMMPFTAVSEAGVGRSITYGGVAVLSSGFLRLGALQILPKDRPVSVITIISTSAAVTPTNQWFCLVRQIDFAVLGKTADDLTTPWPAGAKGLPLASIYTPADDELVYLGVLVVAATVPSLLSWSPGNTPLAALDPKIAGNSTGGLTTPASLGATAGATSGSSSAHYGYTN